MYFLSVPAVAVCCSSLRCSAMSGVALGVFLTIDPFSVIFMVRGVRVCVMCVSFTFQAELVSWCGKCFAEVVMSIHIKPV